MYMPICTIFLFSFYNVNDFTYPTEILLEKRITNLPKDSILLLKQIRTIDKSRIVGPKVGVILDNSIKDDINNKLRNYFDL